MYFHNSYTFLIVFYLYITNGCFKYQLLVVIYGCDMRVRIGTGNKKRYSQKSWFVGARWFVAGVFPGGKTSAKWDGPASWSHSLVARFHGCQWSVESSCFWCSIELNLERRVDVFAMGLMATVFGRATKLQLQKQNSTHTSNHKQIWNVHSFSFKQTHHEKNAQRKRIPVGCQRPRKKIRLN